jgi:hypothetical protein
VLRHATTGRLHAQAQRRPAGRGYAALETRCGLATSHGSILYDAPPERGAGCALLCERCYPLGSAERCQTLATHWPQAAPEQAPTAAPDPTPINPTPGGSDHE